MKTLVQVPSNSPDISYLDLYNGTYYGIYPESSDVPAILTEEVSVSGVSSAVLDAFEDIMSRQSISETWILGASYNRTIEFAPKHDSKCGREFCYQKSLAKNQICKQGKLSSEIDDTYD